MAQGRKTVTRELLGLTLVNSQLVNSTSKAQLDLTHNFASFSSLLHSFCSEYADCLVHLSPPASRPALCSLLGRLPSVRHPVNSSISALHLQL